MASYTEQMKAWAKIYSDTVASESFLNESKDEDINEAVPMVTVDDKYIAKATKLLADLQKKDPQAYKLAMDKLQRNKGHQLVDVDTFVSNRYNAAQVPQPKMTDVSRDDMMQSVADKNKSIAPSDEPSEQPIKEIWVKSLDVNENDDTKSVAKLELTYSDGSKEDVDFSIGTSGTQGGYEQADRLYKELKKSMPGADDLDVRLSMVRVAFNDYRIKWSYGPSKTTDKTWSFAAKANNTYKNPAVKRAKKSWLDASKKNQAIVYQSGNTKIYKTEAEDCDESVIPNNKAQAVLDAIIEEFSQLSNAKTLADYVEICDNTSKVLEDYGVNV